MSKLEILLPLSATTIETWAMKIRVQSDKCLEFARENIWRIAANQKILWRCWDGDYIVFSSLSGKTHILDIASGRVLRRIMNGPSITEDIRSEICGFLEVKNDAELGRAVDKILNGLEDVGLVEAVI